MPDYIPDDQLKIMDQFGHMAKLNAQVVADYYQTLVDAAVPAELASLMARDFNQLLWQNNFSLAKK